MIVRKAVEALAGRVLGRPMLVPMSRRLRHLTFLIESFGIADVDESGEQMVLRRLQSRGGHSTPRIFDVGANQGNYVGLILEHLPEAEVHAFEPNPAVYEQLQARFANNPRVKCIRLALGAKARRAALYGVPGESPYSRLTGLSSLTQRELGNAGLKMDLIASVEVDTVDSYCRDNGIEQVDLLKLDVEGHELDVLSGAAHVLSSETVRAIQFEFGGANIDTGTFLRDFVRMLEPRFELFRVLRHGLLPLCYSERNEVFLTANYFAERRLT